MKKYRNAFYRKRKIHLITCNVCGEPIKQNELGYHEDFISIEKTWGYGSEFDGETHVIDICQDCYESFLKRLCIEPLCCESDVQKDGTGS